MQGNLKQIALPEVLQFISMGKSTGTLTVQDASNVDTTLMIHQGRIINSTALERQRRLGDLLVHRGILKRSTLARALNIQRTQEPEKKIGEILLERDLIQQDQIREVLRLQLEEEIWNLFALQEGDFRFEQCEPHQLGEALVQIDIEPLLLEGSRRQDEWQQITQTVPDDRVAVAVKPLPQEKEKWPKLSQPEWRVLAQINGRFPIRAIVNRSGLGKFEVSKILVELMNRGIIYVVEHEQEQQQAIEELEVIQKAMGQPTPLPAKGVGGLLSRLTGAKKEDRAEALQFISPLGSLAHIINRITDRFFAQKDLKITAKDHELINQLWQDLMISFTKADLIYVENRHVNTEKLERFLDMFEFSDPVQDAYEDSLEALLQLLDGIYRVFAQRTGERPAARVVREILEDTIPRLQHKYANDLRLDERIQMVLRLAA